MRASLTSLDRCDRCRAQAIAVTEHEGRELLWCGHHYSEHVDHLQPNLVLFEPYREEVPA